MSGDCTGASQPDSLPTGIATRYYGPARPGHSARMRGTIGARASLPTADERAPADGVQQASRGKESGGTGDPAKTPGTIVFGTSVDTTDWTVANRGTTFAASDEIGWVAYLSEDARSSTLTFTLVSVDEGGTETPVDTETVQVGDQSRNVFGHAANNALGSLGAGTYTIRYARPGDGKVLAAGTVTITA
jgi:hypothetical protein